MNRRILIVGAIAAALAALLIWVFFLRGDGGKDGGGAAGGPTAPTKKGASKPRLGPDGEARGEGDLAVLEDDDREGTLRLEGIVLDAADAPVAGATVVVSTNPPRTTTTGEDGTFFFEKLVGRPYRLVAWADAGVAGPVTARLTASSDPVTLKLGPAADVEVTVLDAAKRTPIAGATVEIRGLAVRTATTGQDGVAMIDGVVAGWHSLVAWAPGYGKSYAGVAVARPASAAQVRSAADREGGPRRALLDGGDARVTSIPVMVQETIELRPGAAVSGVVRTRDGTPVEGALVGYSSVSDWMTDSDPRRDAVRTDAKGAWRVEAIAAGSYRFVARHRGYAPGSSALITLDGTNERRDVEIVLDDGGRIAGTVVKRDGTPVAGAAVRAAARVDGFSMERARQTTTGEDGRFELAGLPRKKLQVVAIAETATSETAEVDLIKAASVTDLELVLELDGVIAGIVVDDQGEPIAEAQAAAMPDFRSEPGRRAAGRFEWRLRSLAPERADAGGRFEIHGLRPGDYRVGAARPGKALRPFMREGVPAQVGDTDVRIVLPEEGGVKGKVLTAEGTPPDLFIVGFGMGGGTPFTTSDGSFELDDVPPGERTLVVQGPTFDRAQVTVVVTSDEVFDAGTITVTRGRTISGRVLTPQGAPVAGAQVVAARRLFGDGTSTSAGGGGLGPRGQMGARRATSDEEGWYTLYGVGTRDLALAAEHEEHGRSTTVTVPGGTEPIVVDVVLHPFASLQGKVTRGGAPLEGIAVNVTSQSVPNTNFVVQTGPDGAYRFDRLAPDTYLLQALEGQNPITGFGFHTTVVTIAPGEAKTVDIAMPESTGSIVVTPVPTNDRELRVAEVRAVPGPITAKNYKDFELEAARLGGGDSGWAPSLGGMPATISNLRPATYTVCVAPYPSELRGMQQIFEYREREGDNLPIFCTSVEVVGGQEHPVSIPVEVPAFVPDPTPQAPGPIRGPGR